MKEIDMAGVHAAELDMLKEVAGLCEKHGLRYTLYCGTLLGAVRHGGFIPWDDDIDLAMPLKDYYQFRKVAGELPERFTCSFYGNPKDFHCPWIKISADGTTHMQEKDAPLDLHWGLFLDIYPFIGAAPTALGVRIQRGLIKMARRLRSVPLYRARKDREPAKRILYLIPPFLLRAVSGLLFRIAMRDPEKCERIGTIDLMPFDGKFLREDWREMTEIRFEDGMFRAPVRYDKILRTMYGDYMKPPPEEDRHGHVTDGGAAIIDPHRDFREYRRELLER